MERSLDDIALFLAVADAGGLTGAVRSTGQSAATLSRRMATLERRFETRLFERGKRGYTLTAEGRSLLAEAEPLRQAAAQLERWPKAKAKPRLRIATGHWTARFIAMHIHRVWGPEDPWVPEFLTSNATVDIARREADIGIRNRAPEQSWLAGRKTSTIPFAAFASDPGVSGYIVLAEGAPSTPSDRWVRAHHGDALVTSASDIRLAANLAAQGVGRVMLPVFAGTTFPGLNQVSPIIDALTHEEWLVAHHDARHDPPVRAGLDALTRLLTDRDLRPS